MENLILYGALGLLTLLLIIALILLGTQRRRFTRDLEAQRDELLDALEQERDDHQRALTCAKLAFSRLSRCCVNCSSTVRRMALSC